MLSDLYVWFHLNAPVTAGIQPKVCGSHRGAAQRSTNDLPQTCWWRQLRQTQQPKARGWSLLSHDQTQDVIWYTECVTSFSTCGLRLQRPNVYLPVHLYGQLVHDKTGCHLLEAQVMNSAYFWVYCCYNFKSLAAIRQPLYRFSSSSKFLSPERGPWP